MAPHKVPHARYDHDVDGFPVFAAVEDRVVYVSPENQIGSVPQDDHNCAIALGVRRQFNSPYVSIGRSRSDIALPHPQGVVRDGYGETKWAVIRFKNSPKAKEIIIAADTGGLDNTTGVEVRFLPQKSSLLPEVKRERNKRFRQNKGTRTGTRSGQRKGVVDHLTELGVRTLTGQRER